MAARTTRSTWTTLYALISGLCGLAILSWPSVSHDTTTDLPILLLVTVVVLVVSWFRVPICRREAEYPSDSSPALASLWNIDLSLEGALLLGATLAKGPAFGSWAAFIAGLVTPFVPHRLSPPLLGRATTGQRRWMDNAIAGLLDGGRNVAALSLAWLAYWGLGGVRAPRAIDAPLALALGILFVAYALVRSLWTWPVLRFQGEPARRALERLLAPGRLAVELCPLPIALLVSATLSELGWSNFFLLFLVLAGLGAVMRQMTRTIQSLHGRVALLEFAARIRNTVAECPQTVDALCSLARSLCDEIAQSERFDLGLYNAARTQITLRTTSEEGEQLPAMTLPSTPMWEWLSTRSAPLLIQFSTQLEDLPFALPPGGGQAPFTSAILIPLESKAPSPGLLTGKEQDDSARTLGAMALLSTRPYAFDERDVTRVREIAHAIGPALAAAQPARPPETSRARHAEDRS